MGLGIRVNHQILTNLEIFIWYELTELALWKLAIGFLVPKQKEKIWLSEFYFWKSRHFLIVSESHSVMSTCLGPCGLYSPWNSLGQNTGVVAVPFPRGSSQPGHPTQASCISGRFFTSWATREAKNSGACGLSLLQWIFPTQESNQSLLHCRRILYQLSYQGSPKQLHSNKKKDYSQH